MAQRFKDAVNIWGGGACNSLAVANALVRAIKEIREEGKRTVDDPAVKLIADQLCQLLGLPNPLIDVSFQQLEQIRRDCCRGAGISETSLSPNPLVSR